MRQTKTRMELFSFYDHRGIAAHLERQAREGWMLEKIGTWGWKYRRIEPSEIKFYVTYFPKASAYDPGPSEQEQTFRAYCEEAGWKLAASSAQLQVFYCDDPDPVPIETDALLQVENIHAAAKRTTLFSNILLGGMGLMQMIMWVVDLLEDPVGLLADYAGWFRGICWINLIALCAVEVISYFVWYKKAKRLAEEEGALYPTRSNRVFQTISLVLVFAMLLLWIVYMQSRRMMIVTAIMYGYLVVLIAAVNGCRLMLKKWKVSTNTNRVVTMLVDIVLAFGMMGLITWCVIKLDIPDRQPIATYDYYGRTREVYADELPVAVEDLLEVNVAGYSKELEVKETFLAAIYDASQTTRWDMDLDHQPTMNYRLAVSKLPALTQWFWNGWIDKYPDGGERLVTMDPDPWGAEEAYREWIGSDEGGNFSSTWFIRWKDRFVCLTAYRELTEEQMGIIAERLTQWPEGGSYGS